MLTDSAFGLGPVARFIVRLMIGPLRKACVKDLQALAAHLNGT